VNARIDSHCGKASPFLYGLYGVVILGIEEEVTIPDIARKNRRKARSSPLGQGPVTLDVKAGDRVLFGKGQSAIRGLRTPMEQQLDEIVVGEVARQVLDPVRLTAMLDTYAQSTGARCLGALLARLRHDHTAAVAELPVCSSWARGADGGRGSGDARAPIDQPLVAMGGSATSSK
jgi:hypothetical protein